MNFYIFGNNHYGFKKDGTPTPSHGSLKETVVLAVNAGIDIDVLTETVVDMQIKGHTRANFGFNGTFIFSSEK